MDGVHCHFKKERSVPVNAGRPYLPMLIKQGDITMNNKDENYSRYIYWLDKEQFNHVKASLSKEGYKVSAVLKTPCEVLKACGKKLLYASPSVFRRICTRQGSWYLQSDKAGKTMLASEQRLPERYDMYLESNLTESTFQPDSLPSKQDLKALVKSAQYTAERPDEWEKPGIKDSVMFKVLFTLTGFWKKGDNLKSHWLNHRANHANFLANEYTTEVDGQDIAYSVTGNDGVCSSCVEFFGIIKPEQRKYVRSCPGSVTFAGVKREVYYDVKPLANSYNV